MRKFYLGVALAIAAFTIPSLATADVVGTLGADVRVTGDLDTLPTGGDRGDENGGGGDLILGLNTGNVQNWTLFNFDLSSATAADVATGGSLVIDVSTGFTNGNHGDAGNSFSVFDLFAGNSGFVGGGKVIGQNQNPTSLATDGTVTFVQQAFNTNDWVDAAGADVDNFIFAFDSSSALNTNTVSGWAQGAAPVSISFDFDAATGQSWLDQGFADFVLAVDDPDGLNTSRFVLINGSAQLTVLTAVPEPSSAVVLGLALGGLVMRRKRR